MPGGPLLAAYVLGRTTDVDNRRLFLRDEKAEEEEEEYNICKFSEHYINYSVCMITLY